MNYFELDEDYVQMARDYDLMAAQAEQDAEELRQLRTGEAVVVPCDIEHARSMFKMASFYLSQHDTTFALTVK